MKALIISVHPDDETLGVGGTILKHHAEGDFVAIIQVTDGNKHQEKLHQKIEEAYQGCIYWNLGFGENTLCEASYNELIPLLSKHINIFQPDIMYIPYFEDAHSDHRIVNRCAMVCTKRFRFPFLKTVLMYEVISETDHGRGGFVPNWFVDIGIYTKQKAKILMLFESEIEFPPSPRSHTSIEALQAYRGSQSGFYDAEAFQLIKYCN